MSGLYKRALEIYHVDSNRSDVPWDSEPGGLDEIPASEREAVLRQIDDIIESNRLRVGTEELKTAARARGGFLPVLANLAIVGVAAALIVFFSLRLNRQEQLLQAGPGTIRTAESLVVQAVRQESAEQLKKKNSEIQSIQDRLDQASEQRDSIQSEAEAAIKNREKQFSDQLQAALASERARLARNGVSTPEIESRLKDYEAQQTANYRDQLAAFKTETEARAAEREKAVNTLIATYQSNLQKSQNERNQIEQEYAAREAQLTQQAKENTQQLEQRQTQTQAELQKLQAEAAQDKLLTSQILSSYAAVRNELSIPDYPRALDTLSALRASFDKEPAVSSQAIQERRPVDIFIISSLEDLIHARTAQPVRPPTVNELKAAQEAADRFLVNGAASFNSDNWQRTLVEYRSALELLLPDKATAEQLVTQVAGAGFRIAAAKDATRSAAADAALAHSTQLLENLKQIRDRVASLPATPSTPDMTGEETATLLQAKLLVWQILSTDPVRTKYPKLYETMQRYFDAFAEQQQKEGRRAALGELLSIIGAVGGHSAAELPPDAGTTADERAAIVAILNRMTTLVR